MKKQMKKIVGLASVGLIAFNLAGSILAMQAEDMQPYTTIYSGDAPIYEGSMDYLDSISSNSTNAIKIPCSHQELQKFEALSKIGSTLGRKNFDFVNLKQQNNVLKQQSNVDSLFLKFIKNVPFYYNTVDGLVQLYLHLSLNNEEIQKGLEKKTIPLDTLKKFISTEKVDTIFDEILARIGLSHDSVSLNYWSGSYSFGSSKKGIIWIDAFDASFKMNKKSLFQRITDFFKQDAQKNNENNLLKFALAHESAHLLHSHGLKRALFCASMPVVSHWLFSVLDKHIQKQLLIEEMKCEYGSYQAQAIQIVRKFSSVLCSSIMSQIICNILYCQLSHYQELQADQTAALLGRDIAQGGIDWFSYDLFREPKSSSISVIKRMILGRDSHPTHKYRTEQLQKIINTLPTT